MLLLLIAVVFQDGLERCVLADFRPLVVPIDGFQLFHERDDRAMHVARFGRQLFHRLVVTDTGHLLLLIVDVGGSGDGWNGGACPSTPHSS